MDEIRNFIDLVGQGNNVAAKDALEELLANKAFDSLETRKQEIASSLFTGVEIEEPESTETPVTEPEQQ